MNYVNFFVTSSELVSVSRRTLLHGVSELNNVMKGDGSGP